MTVQVEEEVPLVNSVTLEGEQPTIRPVGDDVSESVTLPVRPPRLTSVTVKLPAEPDRTTSEDVSAVILKSMTVIERVVVCIRDPLVPVMVKE